MMEKAKSTTGPNQTPSVDETPATAFECAMSCSTCPYAALGCSGSEFNSSKEAKDQKVEVERPKDYIVMPEKTTPRVVEEVKSKPEPISKPELKSNRAPQQSSEKKHFEDIWHDIDSSYGHKRKSLEPQKENVKAPTHRRKAKPEINGETARKKTLHKDTQGRVFQAEKTAKTTPVEPTKIEAGKSQGSGKKEKIAKRPEQKVHRHETKQEQRLKLSTATEKVEKRSAKQETTPIRRHERRSKPRQIDEEKPQIFLNELDICIHDSAPLVFEPVLVIDHEFVNFEDTGSSLETRDALPMPLEAQKDQQIDPVEAARALATRAYDSYHKEINDIDEEAHAATVAYESTRDGYTAEPFIERAKTVNNELLDNIDIEHDNDLSDSLPQLAIDGITDPDMGIEKVKVITPATATPTTLLAKLKLKLVRFLLRNMVSE